MTAGLSPRAREVVHFAHSRTYFPAVTGINAAERPHGALAAGGRACIRRHAVPPAADSPLHASTAMTGT